MGIYKTKHGTIEIDGDNGMERVLASTGEYMYDDIEACLPYIRDTVVDVGAHVGLWTVPMSKKANKVIAIEASDLTFGLLKRNVDMNKAVNVELHNILLGDPCKKYSAGKTTSSGSNYYNEGGSVNGHTLDSFIHEKISFIKIDVEGMEPEVLFGAKKILEESRPIFLIEVNPKVLRKTGKRAGDIEKFFLGMNYNFYRFNKNYGWCSVPFLMNSFYNFLAVPKEQEQPKSMSFLWFVIRRVIDRIINGLVK